MVAEGWNRSSVNPTWHGEIDAINRLIDGQAAFDGRKFALYTTAEPCPMCQGAILWMGIETVVVDSEADENAIYLRHADEMIRIGPPRASASFPPSQ